MDSESGAFELMERMADAWERGDGQAYGALFTEDAQYVTAPGKRLHGRQAIAESHQQIFNSFFKRTKVGRNYQFEEDLLHATTSRLQELVLKFCLPDLFHSDRLSGRPLFSVPLLRPLLAQSRCR